MRQPGNQENHSLKVYRIKAIPSHTVTPPVTLLNNSVQSVHQNTNYSVSKRYVVFSSSYVSPNNNTCKVLSI